MGRPLIYGSLALTLLALSLTTVAVYVWALGNPNPYTFALPPAAPVLGGFGFISLAD